MFLLELAIQGSERMTLKRRPAQTSEDEDVTLTSEIVMGKIATGSLVSKRTNLKRKQITMQLHNIRTSCRLGATTWSKDAQDALEAWLVKKRKTDRRSVATAPLTVAVAEQRKRVQAQEQPKPTFQTLNAWLRREEVGTLEGHVQMAKRDELLVSLLPRQAFVIAQTGFNVGHSALLFLSHLPCKVVSFELNHAEGTSRRKACEAGAKYLEYAFPGRHTIVYGNSQKTLKQFAKDHAPCVPCFDVIFVDGGHSAKCAAADLENFRALARPGATLIIDDVRRSPQHDWEIGPTKAWVAATKAGIATQKGCSGGMAWGYYCTRK